MRRYRLAVLASHPIQYLAPLFRRIALEPDIHLVAYYCSKQGLEPYLDRGFGSRIAWDIPLTQGYECRFLPNWRKGPVGGFTSLINPAIATELARGRFDAVWVHGHNSITNLIAIVAARLTRTPVLMRAETHLLLRRSAHRHLLRPAALRALYAACDGWLAIGTRNAEFYRAHGVPDEQIFRAPYAVDNSFFMDAVREARTERGALRQAMGIAAETPLILYASKLQPRKRAADLLCAYERLRESGVSAALVFVGSGEEEEPLRAAVAQRGVHDVHFAGFQNQRQLPRYFAAADIFALPSENEPWALVLNEAMCAGLPIVCSTEIGAVPDLVRDGQNGLLHVARDIDGIARCLTALARDPARREAMGAESLRIIGNWGYAECIEGIRSALRAVAKGGAR